MTARAALQTANDTYVGTGQSNGAGTYTLSSSVGGLSAGTYTYYAVATDNNGVTSTPATATENADQRSAADDQLVHP